MPGWNIAAVTVPLPTQTAVLGNTRVDWTTLFGLLPMKIKGSSTSPLTHYSLLSTNGCMDAVAKHHVIWFEPLLYGRLDNSYSVVVLSRKQGAGNPIDFFDKTFEEYKNGFAANGNFVSTMLYQTMWRWIRQCNTLLDNYTLYQTMQHFVREWITLSENATLCQKMHYFAGEGWLGLEKLHQLTKNGMYRLKVSLNEYF